MNDEDLQENPQQKTDEELVKLKTDIQKVINDEMTAFNEYKQGIEKEKADAIAQKEAGDNEHIFKKRTQADKDELSAFLSGGSN